MEPDFVRASPPCHIRVTPPGPTVIHHLRIHGPHVSSLPERFYPLVIRSASGAHVVDLDNNIFLDFSSGAMTVPVGHCNKRVEKAAIAQMQSLPHWSASDAYNTPANHLAERLTTLAPGISPKEVFFTTTGAEAVETAIKIAKYSTGRDHLISFEGAFHGYSLGALSLLHNYPYYKQGFGSLLPSVHSAPYGDIDYLEDVLFRREVLPEEVAAIFVEPIQGSGGIRIPDEGFLPALREICDEYEILLVTDEVQTGIGRTGKLFASEAVESDILLLAKGIANGFPLGAVIYKSSLVNWIPGNHGSTFGGNPVSCAAALVTLEIVKESLLNISKMGERLMDKLRKLYPIVRGQGLMIGIELEGDDPSGYGLTPEIEHVRKMMFESGLLVLVCGSNVLYLYPMLISNEEEIDKAVELLSLYQGDCGAP